MIKFFTKLLIGSVLILSVIPFHESKAQIAGWFFMSQDGNGAWRNSNGTETTVSAHKIDANLANTPTLTRGSGLATTSSNTRTFNARINAIPDNTTIGLTEQEAVDKNVYYEITLQPAAGKQINIGRINFRYRRAAEIGPTQMIWKYFVGNVSDNPSKTDFANIGAAIPLEVSANGLNARVDGINAITALQQVGATKKVVLRAYFWGSKNTTTSNNSTAIGFGKSTAISDSSPFPEYGALSIFDSNALATTFAPWDQVTWASCYDNDGKLIKPFPIYTDVVFETRATPWKPVLSSSFSASSLFDIKGLGITVDGNGVEIDATSTLLNQPLSTMYTLGSLPWNLVPAVSCIYFSQASQSGFGETVIKNFNIKGFYRGVRLGNPGVGVTAHAAIVENCNLSRNVIGLYTNGNNAIIRNNEIVENGFCGVYSGYRSYGNTFVQNTFRDNVLHQSQASYGEFVGDTYYNTNIVNNTFAKSLVNNTSLKHIGISIYRNEGEDNQLREDIPMYNVIENNTFDTYSIAVHVASRMGRHPNYDIAGDARDYAFYNQIKNNAIKNSSIGIKINSEGNTIDGNIFTNTDYPIVLHSVFFGLKNTTINNQPGETVHLWYVKSDYSSVPNQAYLFDFHDNINGSITKAEKRIEVFSTSGTPNFTTPDGINTDLFKLNPSPPTNLLWDYRVGNPTVVRYGEFQANLPGKEMAAIWNDKISRVNNTDYYSILIFDQNGTEINRSGLSTVGWSQLAVGYFTRTSGEMEIAAVPKTAINGKYPVYIFRRGYKEPEQILYADNTDASITISTDTDDKLVVSFGSLPLKFLSFEAKADALGKTADLRWKTTNEVDVKNFVLERRTDNSDFIAIATKNANNTTGVNSYTFKDEKLLPRLNYYRIKQVDNNGAFQYSDVAMVQAQYHTGLGIAPNPVIKELNITHPLADTSSKISILSMAGKSLIDYRLPKGLSFSSLDVSNLANGTYLLVYTNQKERLSIKFIKK